MSTTGGSWDLQEAISDQRAATRSATQPLLLTIREEEKPKPVIPTKYKFRSRKPPEASQRAEPALTLQVFHGPDEFARLEIAHLLSTAHEIRLVPPTRATLLYSAPGGPAGLSGSTLGRSQSQDSGTGTPQKGSCFLRLCFQSLGDLKTASQTFLRLGLRCTTKFRPLSRTPSSASLEASPFSASQPVRHSCPGQHLSHPADAPSTGPGHDAPRYTPLPRRTMSEHQLPEASHHAMAGAKRKRSQSPPCQPQGPRPSPPFFRQDAAAAAAETMPPSSSFLDSPRGRIVDDTPRPQEIREPGRLDSRSQDYRPLGLAVGDLVSRPPPRRELPEAVKRRQLSQSTSLREGRGRSDSQASRPPAAHGAETRTATAAVQTEIPFPDPEALLLDGMELFQNLAKLQQELLQECMGARQGRDGDGDADAGRGKEEEARLVSRYAVEFGKRFVAMCSEKTKRHGNGR